MLKALIFDLDGVIVDSEPLHFRSDILTFRDYGMSPAEGELERYVGTACPEMWAELIKAHGIPDTTEGVLARQNAYKVELLEKTRLQAIPGALELLEEARLAGLKTAVASSSPRYFIAAVLQNLGIMGQFDAIVSGEEVAQSKPAPDVFLKAAEMLGVSPADCLVVEDSAHGLRAAKAAGMRCVGFVNPNSGAQALDGADAVVTGLGQIALADFMKPAGKEMKVKKGHDPDIGAYRYDGKRKLELSKLEPGDTGGFGSKSDAAERLAENIRTLVEEQAKLYAQGRYALLVILQAMDTAGKDSAIKHIMSGLNPQGTEVYSFKQPSAEELGHDYLWRASKRLPERGRIGIFNRSYYEEVLVVRVHNLVGAEKIPPEFTDDIWEKRFRQINHYEEYLRENGIIPLKFFLHISRDEQRERLLERIEDKAKNWKFSADDIRERKYWDEYQRCYEEMINATGTHRSPWYVVPSDKKWYSRLVISEVIAQTLLAMDIGYPKLTQEQLAVLEEYRGVLEEDRDS
jgi:PPK2 family polyphosphate:nucleotide phosphotransferase